MKIGFLILRDAFFKTLGGLIAESLARGHETILLFDKDADLKGKAYQAVTEDKLDPFAKLGAKAMPFKLQDLRMLKEREQFDALVTHEGYYFLKDHLADIQWARKSGLIVVSLAHFFENSRGPIEALTYFDHTYYTSEFGVDIHFGENLQSKRKLQEIYSQVGSPMFDQLRGLSKSYAKAALGIREDKKVVLFFSPVIIPETVWRFAMWRDDSKWHRLVRLLKMGLVRFAFESLFTPTFQQIIFEIKEFCERNNALFVVKSRLKQKDSAFLKDSSDYFISGEEDEYFPVFTSYKLIASADLCITVMSMAALEAVALGVPVWNIAIPAQELYKEVLHPDEARYFNKTMSLTEKSPFNYPKVIQNIPAWRAAKWFQEHNLVDAKVDLQKAKAYSAEFLGITAIPSSEQILSSLEALVEAGRPFRE